MRGYIVESLDRLSRDEILSQLNVFLSIINAGVRIVTLLDGMAYSKTSINDNPYQLIGSLTIMSRAHDESATKSKRIRASWANKRNQDKKLTAKCPAWLALDTDADEFKKIPERCRLIQRIFKMADSGIGKETIAKRFNLEKIPTWGRGNGWHPSYIQKILEGRSVIGEFQPHQFVNGKRTPVGETKKNYFPKVLPDDLFFRVQNKRKRNRNFVGKVGSGLSNLFTGISKCGYTGSPMVFVNKSGYKYLVSDSARRRRGGQYISWPYKDFETSFLTFISELDYAALSKETEPTKLTLIEGQISVARDELEQTQKKRQRLLNAIKETEQPLKVLVKELERIEGEEEQAKVKLQALEQNLVSEQGFLRNLKDSQETLRDLILRRDETDFRFKLRDEIRNKIDRIEVYAGGFPRQREAVTRYAQKHQIEIVCEYKDEGVSGAKDAFDRPGLTDLFVAIKSNGVRTILVERADRLARDLMVGEIILAEFRKLGVKVVAADSGVNLTVEDDDPTRTLMRQMLGAISQWEKSVIVQKLRAARMRIRKTAGRCEGRKPYGITTAEESVIARIRELRSKGSSIAAIARTLNAEGVTPRTPTRKGRETMWHPTMIQRILSRTR